MRSPHAASHRRGIALTTTFRELGILSETAEALEAVGIINPFPIQEMTLPVALSGTDVIGQAKTGTGKTLGFGLPLLERVIVPADVEAGRAKPEQLTEAPQALIVVPTRELCQQVTNDLLTAGKARNVRVLAIYGGRAYEPQVEALKKGIDIVVGTPGRLLDLAGQRKLDLKHVKCLVLDEADEMLDLGFLPDVEKIINMLPAKRQTMLFSATMPGAVIGLARRYMSQPTHIRATAPDDEGQTVANTKQHVFRAHNMDKPEMVSRILQAEGRGLAMIFCRTKRTAADIAEQLEKRGFASGAVHGDLGQGAREQALRAFRNGKVDVLVCTDVAARGIDVSGVTHVINYQSPEDEKTYLHRIGRTGRAGAKGIAVTLVDWDDIPRWQLINKALDLGFNDPVETYSSSPHLYEELNIPAGTKGVLPRAERTRAGLGAEEVEDLGETGGRGRGGRSGGRGQDRDRNRSDRSDRSDRSERGGSGPASAERERPARTPRRRRRTRAGSPLDATATAPAAAVTESAAAPVAEATAPAAAEVTEARTPRRRRRTRAGAGSEALATAEGTTVETEAPAPVAQAEAPVAEAEAPVSKPRRRTRKTAETVAEAAPAEVTEAEAPATKPRRRTRKAAETVAEAKAATPEVTAPDADADAEAEKPKRRTRKATAKKAETTEAPAPEAETEAPATKPRRRTRKAAETVAEAKTATPEVTAPDADAEAEKPKRRTRKTAANKVETTEAPAPEAETEAPATKPRRRTRKAAETIADAATPDADAEAEKPKRRTRKTAAKTVEATETVEAEIPAQATDEAKPRRRTRKAAAAPADATEAEAPIAAPRRRTRKKAEPAEATES
ncbi:DEAD/DEAH box helicase [Streptomyces sp. NPDC005879]|uniref:DEAD/DEAH box helicase n=2 Tax=unclassified Streptomyces TaxID=2593676 RepID=UPI0033D2F21F